MKKIYLMILSCCITLISLSQQTEQTTTSNDDRVAAILGNFEALRNANTINLSWTASYESNISSHELQRSTNGSSFLPIGTITAQNNNTPYRYTYIDATPVEGNNYYRIKTTDKAGKISYSNVLTVNAGFWKTEIRVIPNPVVNGTMNLQMNNIGAGKYNFVLYNSAGQSVFARSIDLTEGSISKTINLPQSLARGQYVLHITNGTHRYNKQVLLH